MPTPVGHTLAGLSIYFISNKKVDSLRELWGFIPFFIATLAADLDFIPGLIIGEPNIYHHGVTHSIFTSIFFAFIFSLIFSLNRVFRDRFLIFSSLFLSHILLDYFSLDTGFPYGIPLFWPFSNKYFYPDMPVFLDIQRESVGNLLFSYHNWLAVLRELLILGPVAVLSLIYNRKQR